MVFAFFYHNKFGKSFVFYGLKGHLAGRVGGGSTTPRKWPTLIYFFQFWYCVCKNQYDKVEEESQ
jgi:hypothetical protein